VRLCGRGFGLGLLPPALRAPFDRYLEAVEQLKAGREPPPDGGAMRPWTIEAARRHAAIEKDYAGYIGRHRREAEKLGQTAHVKVPPDFDYQSVRGLLAESLQKLSRIRPLTLGQAARIPGVTPADLQLLLVHLERRHIRENREKCEKGEKA